MNQYRHQKILELIVLKIKELNLIYQNSQDYDKSLKEFIDSDFKPAIKKVCEEYKISNCWPLKETWNNARFAALSTYSSKQNRILEVYEKSNMNLKEFFHWILKKYDKYEGKEKFLTFLESEI